MPLLPAAPADLVAPLDNPLGALVPLDPISTGTVGSYTGGTAEGDVLSYPQVADFAWYVELPDWRLLQPSRIRSSYSATLGRTLVGTPQADIGVDETVPRGQISTGDMVSYPTVIRPAVPIAVLRAVEDTGGLPVYEQTVVYESALAVLARTFPASVYVTAQQAVGTDTMTAQQVVQWLFDQWTAQYPEFRARPVPPLVLFVPDDDGRYTRTLTTERIVLRQPEGRRRSIGQLLEDLREAFPGYAVSVDSEGFVLIIPPPWAQSAVLQADQAYRAGPSGWAATPADLQVVGRTDITSSPLAVDTEYDDDTLEAGGQIIMLPQITSPPSSTGLSSLLFGQRVPYTVTLAPGVPQDVVAHLVVQESATGWRGVARATYRLLWTRPGSTGGSVSASLIESSTTASWPSARFGTIVAAIANALTLEVAGVPSIGVRRLNVNGNEVALPLPAPALDGSRVINAQSAAHAEVDFVEETPLLPTSAVRWGPTDYTPSGSNVVPLGEYQPFLDDEGAPLIVGGEVTVSWLYELRTASSATATSDGGCAQTGTFGGGPCLTFSGTLTLAPGQSRTVDIVLNGEWAITYGRILTIRWTYRQQPDGTQGIVCTFGNIAARTNNATAARPWMAHVVSWNTDGSVWSETGITYEATYDETDNAEAALSQSLYGRREGPPITVNFFGVTLDDLQQIVQGIVRYNMLPRARYADVQLTAASDLTPDSLNYTLLTPFGVAGVMEAYRYTDARTPTSVLARRSVDLVVLYSLTADLSAPAADVSGAEPGAAGIDGASFVIDAT